MRKISQSSSTVKKNRARFLRLLPQRVDEAVKRIRLVGNCSDKYNYAYTDVEAEKILQTIEYAVKRLRAQFLDKGAEFKL